MPVFLFAASLHDSGSVCYTQPIFECFDSTTDHTDGPSSMLPHNAHSSRGDVRGEPCLVVGLHLLKIFSFLKKRLIQRVFSLVWRCDYGHGRDLTTRERVHFQ